MKREYIYLTALTNERYLPGVMALARSLKEVNTKYDLVVMIPENRADFLKEKIEDYGITKIGGVDILIQPDIEMPESIEVPDYYWKDTFFKLQAAKVIAYKKIILIDSDMLVLKNLDHLFDKSNLSAAVMGKCKHPEWKTLNSGLLIIEPSEKFYDELITCIKPAIERKSKNSLNVGDQDIFQEVYPDWEKDKSLYITENYNAAWGYLDILCKKEGYDNDDFYVIHFPGKEKPWDNKKQYYLIIFILYLLKGKTDKLLYKVKMWKKYRELCEKV